MREHVAVERVSDAMWCRLFSCAEGEASAPGEWGGAVLGLVFGPVEWTLGAYKNARFVHRPVRKRFRRNERNGRKPLPWAWKSSFISFVSAGRRMGRFLFGGGEDPKWVVMMGSGRGVNGKKVWSEEKFFNGPPEPMGRGFGGGLTGVGAKKKFGLGVEKTRFSSIYIIGVVRF